MRPKRTAGFTRWMPLVIALAALPAIVYANAAIRSDTTDVAQWLPLGSPTRVGYERFLEQFGEDEFLIVSWLGCHLDDQRITSLASKLRNYTASGVDASVPTYFHRVITGPEEVAELTSHPTDLARCEALDRLQGIMVGPDHRTTCLLVEVNAWGKTQQHEIIDVVMKAAARSGIETDALRLGGSVYEAVVVDYASEASFDRFLVPSAVISLLLTLLCLRSVRLTLIVLPTAVYCHLMAIALIYTLRGGLNAVLVVLPTLIYVLTISGAIHLVNYYRDAARDAGDRDGAAMAALRRGWLPCTLASVSTAFGLSSLGISRIAPVKVFGLYSALAMMIALVCLLGLVPTLLSIWPAGAPRREVQNAYPVRLSSRVGAWVVGAAVRHAWVLTALGLVSVAGLGLGLPKLQATVEFEEMFGRDTEIIRNYQWLEEQIGPTVPVELLLGFPPNSDLTVLQRVEAVRTVQDNLEQTLDVGGMISAATFVARIPTADNLQAAFRRRIVERRLAGRIDEFVDNGFVAAGEQGQWWRITVRVPALEESDYGMFVESVRSQTEATLQDSEATQAERIEVKCTGLAPVIHEAQLQLFDDLLKSFGLAFLLIYPMMAVLLRGLGSAAVAMIPNVLPAVGVFGGMGWFGYAVDIGSVLCASVALGIAVDDTVHFLTWYRRGIRNGLSGTEAVKSAFSKCASAMFQTTLICSFGMLVFRLSDFVPAQQFASLLFLLLWLSLAGDLILLPALLVGPLRIFFPENRAAHR